MNEHSLHAYQHDDWMKSHQSQVYEAADLLKEANVFIIEAPVCSGKTSLALALSKLSFAQAKPTQFFFTTPAVQENFAAGTVRDRTGVEYAKLPPLTEVMKYPECVIVIDEISVRGPDDMWIPIWKKYANLENVRLILINHPGNKYLNDWLKIIGSNKKSVMYSLHPSLNKIH